jgi:hypothetical protein
MKGGNMLNGMHQKAQGVEGRIWPAVVTGGGVLATVDLAELEATPGSSEAEGSIEVKRFHGITWLLVKGQEGVLNAAHRALEIYLEARGDAEVTVLRRSPEVSTLEGKPWELVIEFRPVAEETPRS